jgi:hypothetical protein
MRAVIDETGKKFGKLTVVERAKDHHPKRSGHDGVVDASAAP